MQNNSGLNGIEARLMQYQKQNHQPPQEEFDMNKAPEKKEVKQLKNVSNKSSGPAAIIDLSPAALELLRELRKKQPS